MQMGGQNSYEILLDKLRDFISKYYLQLWVKGVLQLAIILLSLYLITSTIEYNLYLSTTVRTALFFIFIIATILLFTWWVLRPLIQYWNHRTRLDEKKAANIIGKHFPDVQDKLLNVLYLNDMRQSGASLELVQASIQQKSKSLVLVKFSDAVDWARNRKLAKYAIIPIVLLIGFLLFIPNFLKESTHRLIHYNQTFAPKAPFEFKLNNRHLTVPQFESIEIKASLQGKSLPNELNILFNGISYPMKYIDGQYSFLIKNVDKESIFRFESMGYLSDEYVIDIVPKPILTSYELDITPPAYTGIKNYSQTNIGDIQAPEGSTVVWKFKTENVDHIQLKIGSQIFNTDKYTNGFGTKIMLKNTGNYSVYFSNNNSSYIDSQKYSISLTNDAAPILSIQEFKDSINDVYYYAGDVSDDYGISNLYLVVNYGGKLSKFNVHIPKGKSSTFHLSTFDIFKSYPKGAELQYYFEAWDNDQIHGPKAARSGQFHLRKLSEKELANIVDKNTSQIQNELSKSIKEAKQFQKELEEAKKKLIEKSKLDFNDKKMLEDLLKKQEELQQKLEKSKEDIKKNFEKKNELTQQENNILEQQKHLEEMVEQMKNPELKELLEKINNLLEKVADKKELMQNVEQLDMKSEKMEKNMDRLLQLYKNLDYQQKLNDMIDKLDELGKEQKKEALESELNKASAEKQLEKQKEITKQLQETQKKMEELGKLNNEVNKTEKKEYEDIKNDLNDAEKEQQDAEKELEDGDMKQGGEKQNKASDKIEQAKKKLESLKKNQKKKQNAEDIKTIRRLLENIIYLSFEQEKIVEKTKTTSTQAPSYTKIIQTQQKLKEDFRLVEDSLYRVASRQVKVRKSIFEEVDKINQRTQQSIQKLVERRPDMAISSEQFVMTSYNNLGLMLSESLKNLQDEDQDNMDSDNPQMCNNPKKGKKKKLGMSMEKLAEMQQQLNQQMEQLQKQMKEKAGQGKGGNQEGKSQSDKQGKSEQSSKEAAEFARIAAQQQAIRNALKKLEELSNSPDKSGKKPLGNGLQDAMDKMNQTEKELVNKQLYEEMLKRQKDIQIKLLESAKAEREQDEENKRESERAKNIKPELPSELKQYLDNKKQNESQIQRTPVGLMPYFKSLSEKYFQLIKP